MTIPYSETFSTSAMNRVFDDKTASYKFYWFLSLLDMHVKEKRDEMLALEVAARMVAYAWYPIEYFHLLFGKGDQMEDVIKNVSFLTKITVDDKLEDKKNIISDFVFSNKQVKDEVKKLLKYVPYRFLSPWLQTSNDSAIKSMSQSFTNDCLYSLTESGVKLLVTINPKWSLYLKTNYDVLREFALWNLTLFLQAKNPNVPNIAGKLIRPEKREALTAHIKFWNKVIEIGGPITCIYTDTPLGVKQYELDHFMPWSFVSHNQNWNLIPANGSFNSSKSNRIPDLDYYLPKIAKIQHRALRLYVPHSSRHDTILSEYFALDKSPQKLIAMSDKEFLDAYRKIFTPLSQMALNMGFRTLNHE